MAAFNCLTQNHNNALQPTTTQKAPTTLNQALINTQQTLQASTMTVALPKSMSTMAVQAATSSNATTTTTNDTVSTANVTQLFMQLISNLVTSLENGDSSHSNEEVTQAISNLKPLLQNSNSSSVNTTTIAGNTDSIQPSTQSSQGEQGVKGDKGDTGSQTDFLASLKSAQSAQGLVVDPSAMVVDMRSAIEQPVDTQVTGDENTPLTLSLGDFTVDSNTQNGIQVATVPAEGILQLNVKGVWQPVQQGQNIALSDISLGNLRFVPDADEHGVNGDPAGLGDGKSDYAKFDYVGTLNSVPMVESSTMTVDIRPAETLQGAAASVDTKVTGEQNTPLPLSLLDFSISSSQQNGLTIVTLPQDGQLQINNNGTWQPVTKGQNIPLTTVNNGALRFVPDTNESGIDGLSGGVGDGKADYARFDYVGTLNGDPTAPNSTMAVDINPVQALISNIVGKEDTPLTLTMDSFKSLPKDGSTIDRILIKTLPQEGAITLNGTPVTANQEVSTDDIKAGKLVFTPDENESGFDAYNSSEDVGNMANDYARLNYASIGTTGTYGSGQLNIDIAPVAEKAVLLDYVANHYYYRYGPLPEATGIEVLKNVLGSAFGTDNNGHTGIVRTVRVDLPEGYDHDGSQKYSLEIREAYVNTNTLFVTESGVVLEADEKGHYWGPVDETIYHLGYGKSQYTVKLHSQEVDSKGTVLDSDEATRKQGTPLVLDMNDDGVQTTALGNGENFKLGDEDQHGWVDQNDGLLALDLNNDGVINNGSELFGEYTQLANGSMAKDGFQALAQYDSNQDGVINNQDQIFNQLKVWQDTDGDGITDQGELKSLSEHDIASINLESEESQEMQNGNSLGLVGNFTTTDGQSHEMADVWFDTLTHEKDDA